MMADSIDLCSVRGISLRSPKAEKTFWHYKKVIASLREIIASLRKKGQKQQLLRAELKLNKKNKEVREFLDKNRKFHITV